MRFPAIVTLTVMALVSCTPKTKAVWIEGAKGENKHAVHEIVITNPPKGLDWDIWGVFDRVWTMPLVVSDESDADMELFDATCIRITPRVEKDTLHIRYDNRYLNKKCRAPRGFNIKFRTSGRTVPVPLDYVFLPSPELVEDKYIPEPLEVWDMIPALKKVERLPGTTDFGRVRYVREQGKPEGWYGITLDGSCTVRYSDEEAKDYAVTTLKRLVENNGGGSNLPNLQIEDWPDFPVRALMFDVARLYVPKKDIFRLIDLMHRAKMNTLLLHLTDDEGWRIAIDALPELTAFGAFHEAPSFGPDGFGVKEGLLPGQNGALGRRKPWLSANGFYTRKDFTDILEYAAKRHIKVIPELDMPGHSSSAVESMRYRARTTGDESFLLTDPGDTSKFVAYLGFTDNVMDPGLESTYRFIGIVLDELKDIYAQAGLTLETVNISGDEVAEGVWMGSPACRALMEEHGWTGVEDLWSHFLGRVVDLLSERGLKFAGYAEVLLGTNAETLDKIRDNSSFLIVWRPLGQPEELDTVAYSFANRGFRMLLSHADRTYMDNAYYRHRDEPGLDWGGTTTERYAWQYDPLHLPEAAKRCPLEKPENILGVEPMLWGDNVYSFGQACYLLFPKVYGMFERCWNASPDAGFDRFYSIVASRELPYLDSKGIVHRKPMEAQR